MIVGFESCILTIIGNNAMEHPYLQRNNSKEGFLIYTFMNFLKTLLYIDFKNPWHQHELVL